MPGNHNFRGTSIARRILRLRVHRMYASQLRRYPVLFACLLKCGPIHGKLERLTQRGRQALSLKGRVYELGRIVSQGLGRDVLKKTSGRFGRVVIGEVPHRLAESFVATTSIANAYCSYTNSSSIRATCRSKQQKESSQKVSASQFRWKHLVASFVFQFFFAFVGQPFSIQLISFRSRTRIIEAFYRVALVVKRVSQCVSHGVHFFPHISPHYIRFNDKLSARHRNQRLSDECELSEM